MVARLALIVNEQNPKTQEPHRVTLLTQRPYWSGEGASDWSLPGGRYKDVDLDGMRLNGAKSVTDQEQEKIALNALLRSLKEELRARFLPEELVYAGVFPNGPWATALFYLLKERRPSVSLVQRGSASLELDGLQWADITSKVAVPGIFADHGNLLEQALALTLAEKKSSR